MQRADAAPFTSSQPDCPTGKGHTSDLSRLKTGATVTATAWCLRCCTDATGQVVHMVISGVGGAPRL